MKCYSATVCRRSNGKGWRGVIRYKDDAGRWRNTTKSFRLAKSKAEAKKMLADWLADVEEPQSRAKVMDYAYAYVDSKVELRSIQPSTAQDYRKSLKGWEPYLGNVELRSLRPKVIEDAIRDMLADLGVTTVRKRYVALKMVLDHAVASKDLRENPMDSVPRPKVAQGTPNAIVGDELVRVKERVGALPLRPWVVAVNLCLYAGLRAEEACGLQVGDIDLKGRVGWVRRSIGYAKGGSYVAPTKSGRSRDFPICDQLARVLSKWLETRSGGPTDWLLGDEMPAVNSIGRKWSMLCEIEEFVGRAGRKPTLHDLRHTFATRCVSSGMDVKTLQSILGHSSAAMTLDVYASPDPAAKQAAGELIAKAI